ncbi:hydroxyproline dehydrogenase-like isoform X2 [Dreissena polymorpha]|uniref:hydroxyproline dehydrogenase-like isoform X2 n=1 Tax=Dreissena polymorpha TaxID=45954 RepID=UPI00226516BF|nr:hydroxyproline dehydrogenase-like isoform X2 [Dreissena polymorpha]
MLGLSKARTVVRLFNSKCDWIIRDGQYFQLCRRSFSTGFCSRQQTVGYGSSIVSPTRAVGNEAAASTNADAVADYSNVFKYKSTAELLRAIFVFKLCTYQIFVKNSLWVMNSSRRLLGRRLFDRLMKVTFYGQFVAGETRAELLASSSSLLKAGVRPILCVPIEEDKGANVSEAAVYERNFRMVMECVRTSPEVCKDVPVAQLKLTAVVPGRLCLSEELGVLLLIDAEYTDLNPALRLISLAAMLKFNKKRPLVAYTYQNYLKKCYSELVEDVEFTARQGACFAAKVVRGAYMQSERRLATEKGHEDPVHENFEATTAMYHRSADFLLDRAVATPDRICFIIASHNEGTLNYVNRRLGELGVPPGGRAVLFGQLYGMADHLSAKLAQSGHLVYKSVPYGPVDETLPYLQRRAVENSSLLGGTGQERRILWTALKQRLSHLQQ